jgi:recombination protein RecA
MALATKEKEKSAPDKTTEKAMDKKSNAEQNGKDKDKESKGSAPQERLKALGMALDSIKKAYGEGSIMRLGDSRHQAIEVVPTGALSLDVALGVGGLPRGRIIEIYGPESSGKTTLAQHVAAEVQKMGGIAAIVDAEHAMDPEYARALGVNVDELLISQPDTGEQA